MAITPSQWQPSASQKNIRQRAALYQTIRHFFAERNVLEVETPILSPATVVDPHIDSLSTQVLGQTYYLQTSPEFFLKRLLAADIGDVYSLGKVFRQGERGRRHHPEFTMLEWYRLGWDEQQLIQEVITLLEQVLKQPLTTVHQSYRDIFLHYLNIDSHEASLETLKQTSRQHIESDFDSAIKDDWLNLLMSHVIEPQLPKEHIVVIDDYPVSQAALARTDKNLFDQTIARRFEVYFQGMELANGYYELCNADEQMQRFQADCDYRQQQGLANYPYDQQLVAALQHGLPDCAGVALGIDRLLMILCNTQNIHEVISFGC